jgi:hypothetical protein
MGIEETFRDPRIFTWNRTQFSRTEGRTSSSVRGGVSSSPRLVVNQFFLKPFEDFRSYTNRVRPLIAEFSFARPRASGSLVAGSVPRGAPIWTRPPH